ncbi:MAG: hypothetical protein MRY83_08905 [Flavobacteriales bacterium]|nr:hypothetical protein [Flavobacteriales bacterium]
MNSNIFIVIILFILSGNSIKAQKGIPNKIRISSGKCSAMCGYSTGFTNRFFIKQLEFDLDENKFRFRKKTKKKFNEIKIEPAEIFTNPKIYQSLDSLYENFTDFKMASGKYYIYRIELIYYKSRDGLPAKIKTMDFTITTNPNKIHPPFIENLINEYHRMIK